MKLLDELLQSGYSIFDAIDLLVEDNHPELRSTLLELQHDADSRVRMYAAVHLARQFHDVRALQGLHEALFDTNQALRKEAAENIWEIGDTDSTSLIRALHVERGVVREAIVDALHLIGWIPQDVSAEVAFRIATRNWRDIVLVGSSAVPHLTDILNDPDGNVRRGAAWALGEIGDQSAIPPLILLLEDTSGDMFGIGERVCDAAEAALLKIGTPEALRAVEEWRANL
nr:HEAT repeat domain-containing protein [Anaerolineae bacterium]